MIAQLTAGIALGAAIFTLTTGIATADTTGPPGAAVASTDLSATAYQIKDGRTLLGTFEYCR
jgi:hypothetical protein